MANRVSSILDHTGSGFIVPNGKPRPGLVALANRREQRKIEASYEAARDTNEFAAYWANADALDADSANSYHVRSKLVPRARHETANNGYVDGMTQSHANFLVGRAPKLRLMSGNTEFNGVVERLHAAWCKAVMFRRKLWVMAHAKVQDGEGFALCGSNERVAHRIKLDFLPFETEQCHTPNLPWNSPGYIDGIEFDEWGNPAIYDVLSHHPGSEHAMFAAPKRYAAKYILHWYGLRRPGQHRGVPEFRSTLNVGAASRRFREATVAAAETAADFTLILETMMNANSEIVVDPVEAMSSFPVTKRTMAAMPHGWKGSQLKAEHPTSTYDSFVKQQLGETARPKGIPYNIAACDSSGYNYSSGKLDHQTYFGTLDTERADGDDLVLDKLFDLWWYEAVFEYGWDADPRTPPPCAWDWPKLPVADLAVETSTTIEKLRAGLTTLRRVYQDNGYDFDDEIVAMAEDYGVTEDEMRKMLRLAIFNQSNQQASATIAETQAKQAESKLPAPAAAPEESESEDEA